MRKFFQPVPYFLLTAILGTVAFTPVGTVFASTTDGTITGYAWSGQIGWINFGTAEGGAHITDSGLSGYAWNENVGWINLDPTHSGVANDSNGALSGSAWAEGEGWIDFTGVTVDSSGIFSGTATGDNSVSINFGCSHCSVSTDWRPNAVRSTSSGGYASAAALSNTLLGVDVAAADLDHSGAVDIYDLAQMLSQWDASGPALVSDLNHDGHVNVYDFSLLMLYWGITYPTS